MGVASTTARGPGLGVGYPLQVLVASLPRALRL